MSLLLSSCFEFNSGETDRVIYRYAHKLNIPDTVFETRSIQEIDRIGVDLVLMYVYPTVPPLLPKGKRKGLRLQVDKS
jgi:hypothetical protein